MPINWQSVITTLLATVGGGGVALAAAAWLTKTLITNRLALDVEAFKTEVRARADAEIERLKSTLQMAALEHQVRFSKLHEKRAEVIAKLYTQLVLLQYAGQRYVLVGGYVPDKPTRDDEYSKTSAKVHEVFMFIEQNQIYLSDRVCTLLEEFVETIKKAVIGVWVYGKYEGGPANFLKEQGAVLMGAAEAFEGRIPMVRQALRDEFRKLLGVEDSSIQESRV
jgi:hypothetical protein